ncbi:protein NYNRIN-like [Mizuhopecten yessoensis]|uniref:protein NYNRIN-like n=1 Tax=Mizuhopecten yessoensis TaxID=6573 RepID=UPI000B45E3C7|nr:protein NYNRIN-like [Mizuhopecten yessoensis]
MSEGESQQIFTNWLDSWGIEKLRKEQDSDPYIAKLKQLKAVRSTKQKRDEMNGLAYEIRVYCQRWDHISLLENGLLYVQDSGSDGNTHDRVLAPVSFRKQILYEFHDSQTAGHLGWDKTLSQIKRRYYWPGLSDDVGRWCRKCDMCARRKPGPGMGKTPLHPTLAQVSRPLDRISIDILSGIPVTANGHSCIMVVCDYFSKWVEAHGLPNHTAVTIADKLCSEFISRFGVPFQILSDRGAEFE